MTSDAAVREQRIQALLQERCDGNKNIIHACAAMCAPTSNKENDSGELTRACHSYHIMRLHFQINVVHLH